MKCCVALSECLLFSCCTRKCSATDLLDCDTCHVLLKLRKADIHCYSDVRTSFHSSWYDRMKWLLPACSGPLEVSAFLHSSLPACCLWLFLRKLKLFIKSPRLLSLEDDLVSSWITLSWCCALLFQVCAGRVRVRLRFDSPGGSGGAQQRDLTRSGRELVVLLYERLLVVEPNLISSEPTSLSYRVTFFLKMTSFK